MLLSDNLLKAIGIPCLISSPCWDLPPQKDTCMADNSSAMLQDLAQCWGCKTTFWREVLSMTSWLHPTVLYGGCRAKP